VQTDDWHLIDRFRRDGAHDAFAVLVERHVGFVYHVCRRRLRDAHLAEDAAQAVFVVLARRAPSSPAAHVTLASWLYRTALHACANARRARDRRQRHESVAAQLRGEPIQRDDHLDDGKPGEEELDRALASLTGGDRDLILMRFYEDRSLTQIGATLSVSTATATKRLSRAVARLRKYFNGDEQRVRTMLCAAAPAGLVEETLDASAAGGAGGASVAVHETAKGVIRTMIGIKAKLIAATTAALVLGVGGGVMSVSLLLAQPAPSPRAGEAAKQPSSPATAPAAAPASTATPRQVMREFGAAIRAGDADAIRAMIDAQDADNRRLTETVCDYIRANSELRAAVAERFGKPALAKLAKEVGPVTPIDYLGAAIDPLIDQLDETIDGDEATLVPPTPDIDKFIFVRTGGRWKISADRITSEWSPQEWEAREGMIRRAGEGVSGILERLRDGELTTLDELKAELVQIQRTR
jgi:RNA polymerase sigma factor (sigma-70 family)